MEDRPVRTKDGLAGENKTRSESKPKAYRRHSGDVVYFGNRAAREI